MKRFLYFSGVTYLSSYAIILIVILVIVILNSCALSLKSPTTQALIKTTVFLAGHEIGKAKPESAKDLIDYTQTDRADILTFFDSWRKEVASRVSDDPIHRKLIQDMLNLVEIDLKFQAPDVQEGIIRDLFKEFVSGLEAGLND